MIRSGQLASLSSSFLWVSKFKTSLCFCESGSHVDQVGLQLVVWNRLITADCSFLGEASGLSNQNCPCHAQTEVQKWILDRFFFLWRWPGWSFSLPVDRVTTVQPSGFPWKLKEKGPSMVWGSW